MKRALEVDPNLSSCSICSESDNSNNNNNHSHNHSHQNHHTHDTDVATISISQEGGIDLQLFNSYIGGLLWEQEQEEPDKETNNTNNNNNNVSPNKLNIFRCKGVVSVINEEEKYVLQGVHTLFEVEPAGIRWKQSEPRITRLVFIGKGLGNEGNRKQIEEGLKACISLTNK